VKIIEDFPRPPPPQDNHFWDIVQKNVVLQVNGTKQREVKVVPIYVILYPKENIVMQKIMGLLREKSWKL
jgi:hypothetical protein